MRKNVKKQFYENYIKRCLDIVISFLAIVILLIPIAIISILVRIKLGSPIIFKQLRPGLNGDIFTMYKFRSMTNATDTSGNLLPDEKRLNSFGKMLRSTSLDELPELFNVLKGDMSLVGPRPQLVRDMVFMNDVQNSRHCVKPGITGLAQVNGRNGISWEKKMKYDVEYSRNVSFGLDIKIIMMTFSTVIKKEGITMQGMETALDYGDYLLQKNIISKSEYNEKQLKANRLIDEYCGKDIRKHG